MKFFLHSDDAGATKLVTFKILESWTKGYIDGFSILANGEALEELKIGINNNSNLKARISAHLNLSEGESLVYPNVESQITDKNGYLNHTFGTLIFKYFLGDKKIFLEQIYLEWKAQVAKVRELVLPRSIDVLDGHMHVHMLPFLFPIACRIANEFDIPSIRITNEVFYTANGIGDFKKISFYVNILKHFILKILSVYARKIAKKYCLHYSENVIGVLYTGVMDYNSISQGIKVSANKNIKELEVILHVGQASMEESSRWENCRFIGFFYLSPNREKENLSVIEFKNKFRQ